MMWHLIAVMVASQSLSCLGGASLVSCPARAVAMNVTTPAEVKNMSATMNCTGKGTFDVTWTGSLQLAQAIEVSGNKQLTVTGSSQGLANTSSDIIDAGSATGIFSVSNGSTLILNRLVLEGGTSQKGAAIDARDSSWVCVTSCTFKNNNATSGGAIYAQTSDIHIDGDTEFMDNSAQEDGGAIFAEQSEMNVDGSITFASNSAGSKGGAIFSTDSNVSVDGYSSFTNNSVGESGGAIFSTDSNVSVDGYSSFTNNSVGESGGALYSESSEVHLSGESHLRYNSAQGEGGAIGCVRSTMYVDGNYSFANNSALGRGGAVMGYTSEIHFNGNTSFTHNASGNKGGAVGALGSDVILAGETSFRYNTGQKSGGAFWSGRSTIHMAGRTSFGYNAAVVSGGAFQSHTTSVFIEGYAVFTNNAAAEDGGAINVYAEVYVEITGIAIFSYNSAVWRGGAIQLVTSEANITGTTSFLNNTGYDGGAIAAHQSPVYIDGNTSFFGNAAEHDGGAMTILGSNATIKGNVDLSFNTATNGGAIYSALNPVVNVVGNIKFFGNQAVFYGGAFSLSDTSEVYIAGTTFESNKGASGGAVSLTSTEGTTGGFETCRFASNNATTGGALYLGPGDKGETEKPRFVQDSVFVSNIAVGLGGALFNTGELEVDDTLFSENIAGEGGLAIHDERSSAVLTNVTFHDNMFSCPSDQYSDAHHVDSPSTCRFELVCQQCSEGCEIDEKAAKVTTDTIPVCEDIPDGVSKVSPTTLQTFDLLEGFYRVSAESRVIRECYQKEACKGGINDLNYCTEAYTGPYCAVCNDGYAPGVMNRCHACSRETRRWSVGLVTVALVIMLFVAFLVVSNTVLKSEDDSRSTCPAMILSCHKWLAKGLPLSAIKIVVVVLQIITQFTEIAGAVYPDEYEAFLAKLSHINLDIGHILSTSCIVNTNFYARLLVATIGPLVVLSLLFGTLFVAGKWQRNTVTAGSTIHEQCSSLGLFILFFVYSSVSFTIFQTFACDELDDGTSYLRADYSLFCTSEKHAAYTLYASIMVCVYPVGIPALFAWWLACNRQDLQKHGREDLAHLQASRHLWDEYSPSCYYFEVVECFRRIVLTGAAVFVLPNSTEQIAILFLLAVVFTFVSESLSPFTSKADMWLYRGGNAIILASMYAALLLKAELADEDSQTSSVTTVVLISANIFLMVTVAVQAALLIKGVYVARRPLETNLPLSTFPGIQLSTEMEPVG